MPLTFLSGYLGAGKTTLINELLATADRPIAVLVNDVGEVNIDARLIRRRHGDTIELTDGCVCCSLSEGFGAAIDQIRGREVPPDHVVVELSGVADPSRVLPWARSAGFRLDGVVTLVDVDQFAERMHDGLASHTMEAQITAADMLLLTKTQLGGVEKTAAAKLAIAKMVPNTLVLTEDTATSATLLSIGARRSDAMGSLPEPTLFDRHIVERLELPNPVERTELKRIIDALPADVVRAKGIGVDASGAHWIVHVVGARRMVTELPAAERLADLEDSALVVIRLPSNV